jgi:hypothetical protein
MTGIGGFLQEFLYGYSGLRWESGDVRLAPSLNAQLRGMVLHDVSWRGRLFTVSISQHTTTVTLQAGSPLPVRTRAGVKTVAVGQPLSISTARPDLTDTSDVVRCAGAYGSSSVPGAVALAGVDGSIATDWQPLRMPATFTARVRGGGHRVSHLTLTWGHLWPGVKKPNVPPTAGPVRTLRASSYAVQVSLNARTWRTVAGVTNGNGTRDVVHFAPARARFVRLRLFAGGLKPLPKTKTDQNPPPTTPMLMEMTVG